MHSMKGKIVLVTGATGGIGKQTAIELAVFGATVLLHARTAEKGQQLLMELERLIPAASFDVFAADFELQQEVEQMAAEIKASYHRLDVLVNNAAIHLEGKKLSHDTIEKTFAVNHLAPFLLTHLLLPLLQAACQPRIVNLSSQLHFYGKFDSHNLQGEKQYNGINLYCSTKLCNLLFTYELAARLKPFPHITVNAVHPGMLDTDLYRELLADVEGSMPQDAADTVVYLCSAPETAQISGEYFINRCPAQSSYNSYSRKYRKQLWKVSEQLTRIQSSQFIIKPGKAIKTENHLLEQMVKFFKTGVKALKQKIALQYPIR